MSTPNTPPPITAQDSQVRHLLEVAWRGRWIIVIATAVALLVGLQIANHRGTIWRAQSRLLIERTGPAVLSAESLLMGGDAKKYVNTQAVLIRSTPVLQDALGMPEVAGAPDLTEVHNKLAWLKQNIRVSVGKSDDIVSVSLDSAFRAEACAIVNAVVGAYRRFHASRNKSTLHELVTHLSDQKELREQEFNEQFEAMREFLDGGGTLGLDPEGSTNFELERLHQLSSALTQAQLEATLAKTEWDQAKSLADTPDVLRQLLDVPPRESTPAAEVPGALLTEQIKQDTLYEDQLNKLKVLRAELLADRTPEHPVVTALDAKIAHFESLVEGIASTVEAYTDEVSQRSEEAEEIFVETYLSYLQVRSESADQKVTEYREWVAAQEEKARALGREQAQYRLLETNLAQTRSIISDLSLRISKISLADVDEADENLLDIEVLDPASVATTLAANSKAATLAIALILGLMLGCGLTWLREILDHRLRGSEDVTDGLGLPLLAVLPRLKLKGFKGDMMQAWEEHPALAEAARSLRTAVYFGIPEGQGKVIQITSPNPGEGKSMIAAQLAIAMAMAGQKTLIVDADLRSPTQRKLHHLGDNGGLAGVLSNGTSADDVIQSTSLDNLDVLTTGPVPAQPAELLGDEAFSALLQELAERYDWVVVDSPPVLAVSDASLIAARCSFSLLVLRVDRSTSRSAVASHEALLAVGSRIPGVVLNDMPRTFGYGYGHEYGNGHRYGQSSEPGRTRRSEAETRRDGER